MAIVHFVDKKRADTKYNMKKVLDYIMREDKTNRNLIKGFNCDPYNSYYEFMNIKREFKQLNNRSDDRMYVHFVQSFPSDQGVTPEQAHELGLKLMDSLSGKYKDFQLVMATHTDKKHIHNHFVLNTVNIHTGKKWQQSKQELAEMKELSCELCKEANITLNWKVKGEEFLEPEATGLSEKVSVSSYGEYKKIKEGLSWKEELRLAIKIGIKHSTNKQEFIENMEKLNYQVKWEDLSKKILFRTPDGKKCGNDKLYMSNKYSEENLLKALNKNKIKKTEIMKKEDAKDFEKLVEENREDEKPSETVKDVPKERKERIDRDRWKDGNYEKWGTEMLGAIKKAKGYAIGKEDFIKKMNALGYDVDWVEHRKNILFAEKENPKHRHRNSYFIPKEKYTKEALEEAFIKNLQRQEEKIKVKQNTAMDEVTQAVEAVLMVLKNNDSGEEQLPLTSLGKLKSLEGQALKEKAIEKSNAGQTWGRE